MTKDQLKKWKEDWTRQVEIEFEADKIRKLDVLHERLPEDGKGVATGPARTIPETLHTFGGPRKSLLTNVRIQGEQVCHFPGGTKNESGSNLSKRFALNALVSKQRWRNTRETIPQSCCSSLPKPCCTQILKIQNRGFHFLRSRRRKRKIARPAQKVMLKGASQTLQSKIWSTLSRSPLTVTEDHMDFVAISWLLGIPKKLIQSLEILT